LKKILMIMQKSHQIRKFTLGRKMLIREAEGRLASTIKNTTDLGRSTGTDGRRGAAAWWGASPSP
jgi:hypothetical protein